MAMIACAECGGKISDTAQHCIHCGAPSEAMRGPEPAQTAEATGPASPGEQTPRKGRAHAPPSRGGVTVSRFAALPVAMLGIALILMNPEGSNVNHLRYLFGALLLLLAGNIWTNRLQRDRALHRRFFATDAFFAPQTAPMGRKRNIVIFVVSMAVTGFVLFGAIQSQLRAPSSAGQAEGELLLARFSDRQPANVTLPDAVAALAGTHPWQCSEPRDDGTCSAASVFRVAWTDRFAVTEHNRMALSGGEVSAEVAFEATVTPDGLCTPSAAFLDGLTVTDAGGAAGAADQLRDAYHVLASVSENVCSLYTDLAYDAGSDTYTANLYHVLDGPLYAVEPMPVRLSVSRPELRNPLD